MLYLEKKIFCKSPFDRKAFRCYNPLGLSRQISNPNVKAGK